MRYIMQKLALVFIAGIASLNSSLVFAYSGAGSECGNFALERAAIDGKPSELEAEIDKVIDRWRQHVIARHQNRNMLSKLLKKSFKPPEAAPRSILRTKFINAWSGCYEVMLLDLATSAGNISNARYLLTNGADPNGSRREMDDFLNAIGADPSDPFFSRTSAGTTTLFMRCLYLSSDRKGLTNFFNEERTPTDVERTRAVYKLLVENGANVNAGWGRENGLQACNDPETIRFLLENGANPNIWKTETNIYGAGSAPLNIHVYRALTGGILPRPHESLQIIEMIAERSSSKRVNTQVLHHICYDCSGVEHLKTCAALAKLIEVPDKRIFISKGFLDNDNARSMRCDALIEPRCENCSWNGRYDPIKDEMLPKPRH
ncbi:hypothetical protein OPU71_11535 [Niveibacterium sp. 24ML]|uniref:hypothetical protein n=1 Tax=Niveibacterium sp. 24ML TaxID=2985512 RepID=UPI00226FFA02|nr:hypothetical protein [Niveibacterium sp. 24ML]MCX9156757.1 hypothetical protein [Niveibacterium sp. 24ML]